MNKRKAVRRIAGVLCLLLIGLCTAAVWGDTPRAAQVPGLSARDRILLRIWAVDSPGGALTWLKEQLRAFEKAHPGISTYLRTVSTAELSDPEAVLPDMLLYMPGSLTDPQQHFLPLAGELMTREDGLLREELLRCGRWQGQQYGLPLCGAGWLLAIDSALEPGSSVTPAPTTLLGRPGPVPAAPSEAPAYPLAAAAQADCALQSPGGTALFTLGLLLQERPPLPEDFAIPTSEEVYACFRKRQCASAMLTTGQAAAFSGLVSGGSGFPFRVMTAQEIITDQVWLASLFPEAPAAAAQLLGFLVSVDAQEALTGQSLHTVRRDLTLYAAGAPAQTEQAAHTALSAVNAYLDPARIASAAWQFFQGQLELSQALLPLM